MATNFEHYKDEILEIVEQGHIVAKEKGNLCKCCGQCTKCDFSGGCTKNTTLWLYSEYKPQYKLTKKERLFCELVETGWIARDKDGRCRWYFEKKLFKTNEYWHNNSIYQVEMHKLPCEFPFIKWQDAEPWSVEDLLKLEVEE